MSRESLDDGHGALWTAPARPGCVLVVDDDRLIRTIYADMLGRHGVATEGIEDGQAALERLRAGGVAAVLCDINMPRLDGMAFLRSLRRLRSDLPVVLVTGSPALASAVQAVELGAYRYLTKPVAEEDLVAVVTGALQAAAVRAAEPRLAPSATDAASGLEAIGAWLDAVVSGLHVVFQPIVDVGRGRVLGFEGLARTRGAEVTGAEQIFHAAERLGRVQELGRILRAQLADAAGAAPPDGLLFVNIHPHDLLDADLYDPASPLSALAGRVVLEITERASLEGLDRLQERIATLRRLGFRLAVDDLGAGFAGLGSFSVLSPEVVKIDISLVRALQADPQRQRVVAALASLARSLGALCVAEGVETESERDALLGLGIDLHQGFLFAHPSSGFGAPSMAGRQAVS